jgi:hypothetical protein
MPVTVTTIAAKRALTTKGHVKDELGLSGSTYDDLLDALIDKASAAIESYCNRIFARQVYSETCPGFGDTELQLSRSPVITVSSVLEDGTAITDYSLGDKSQSFLYRENGWSWTSQYFLGLSGRQQWPMFGTPAPRRLEPTYTVAYTAGYILPSQSVDSQTTISAANGDSSFNDSGSGFPALLKAGDVVVVSGMANAANNGRFLVTGTPTVAKIVVDATLTTEAAGQTVTVSFPGHSDVREFLDIEKAAIETVKTWYFGRRSDPSIQEKQVSGMRVRYAGQEEVKMLGLPATVVGLLRPWVRAA